MSADEAASESSHQPSHFRPKRAVGTQAVLLAGTTGAAQLLTALMYLVAARLVTPSDLGHVLTGISLGTAVVGFIDFGTNSLWVRDFAAGRLSSVDLGRRIAGKMFVAAAISVLWVGVTLMLLPSTQTWIAGPIAFAVLLSQTLQVPLRGAGRGDVVAFAILADRVSGIGLLLVLVVLRTEPTMALWLSITAGSLVAASIAWLLTPGALRPRSLRGTWATWRGAGYFGMYGLATSAQALDLSVLTAFGGAAVTGLYGAVNRWTQPMGLLVSAFSSASAPYLARSADLRTAWRHVRSGIWLPIVAIVICVVVSIFSPFLVGVLIGPKYEGSAPVLRILALATIPGIINQPLSVFLQAVSKERVVAIVMVVNVSVVLVSIALVAPQFGAAGAAAVALVTQSGVAVALLSAVILVVRSRQTPPDRALPQMPPAQR